MSLGPLLHQDWQHLLFLHWSTPAAALRELLPPGLSLDLFQGTAYIGLIPFTVTNSRPLFSPAIPGVSDFHEVNVRTYVLHERNPGVLFFSLDAASRAAVLAARRLYRLPYHHARIEMSVDAEGSLIDYRSERTWPEPLPANCAIRYRIAEGPVGAAPPGTVEHFLIERYTLYTYSNGRLYQVTVEHTPYPIQRAEVENVEETLIWAAGIHKAAEAPLVHYSRGVRVDINALTSIR
jgi:uncharacterized protein YqjF (DUF2071 family)